MQRVPFLHSVLAPWKMYGRLYADNKRLVVWCLVGSLARSLLIVPVSLLAREAIDGGFVAGRGGRLFVIVCEMIGVYIVSAGLSIWVQRANTKANLLAVGGLRRELSRRLHELPRAFLTSQDPSEIEAIIVSDTARVAEFSAALINGFIPSLVTIVALAAYLLTVSPSLGLILLVVGPVTAFVNRKLRARVEASSREYRSRMWEFFGIISRAVRSWDLTSSSNAVAEETLLANKGIESVSNAAKEMDFTSNIYHQTQDFIVSIAGAVVLLVGGLQVQRGHMSLGTFLSFFVVMSLAQSAIRSLLGSLPRVLMGREALLVLHGWIDSVHEPVYTGTSDIIPGNEITFEKVSFAYGEKAILTDVCLTVEAGSVVAILGGNGAGKTTMINLLLGWYRPVNGRVLAGETPFDEISMCAWRDVIGLVHQDPLFLNATVRENICYGRPQTTDQEIWNAATVSASAEMIESLPQGLDTRIGEDGVLLSGGQRQRIALTRALVRMPRILVLDEPTNHLDRVAVKALLERITALHQRPTVIVITHDEDVVEIASHTYLLEGGRLIDNNSVGSVPSVNAFCVLATAAHINQAMSQ